MSYKELSKQTFISPKMRVSYPYLTKPKQDERRKSADPKFQFEGLIPKKDIKEWMPIFEHCKKVAAAKFGDKFKLTPDMVFVDADKPNRKGNVPSDRNPSYKDHYILRCRSAFKPAVVDQRKNTLTDEQIESFVYAGCYVRAQVNAYAYDVDGNAGVAVGFNAIQKVADGEPMSSRRDPSSIFDAVDTGEDNPENYNGGAAKASSGELDGFFS
jgi:hypothetical protein